MDIIDRRLNPKSKSLGNRQRFVRRAKADIREAVRESLKNRKVSDIEGGDRITIRSKRVREPSFVFGRGDGKRSSVLTGNREYLAGDTIPKPRSGGGRGGSGGSADGEGHDDFVFTLTKEEFLDVFFEDLELPNLVKNKLKSQRLLAPRRAGYSSEGSPSRLNRIRTMRNSLARRLALRRPTPQEIRDLEQALSEAEAEGDAERADSVRRMLMRQIQRSKTIAFIDPLDLQYNRFERTPRPITQAVMFCLMDTSASMTEAMKDLAKRFFMLLYLFLSRQYREVDIVFIRHTSYASEVDEEQFFHSTETGGTIVSTAFEEMQRIVAERYPVADWNIYAAQASDGENFREDMDHCIEMLDGVIMPLCQYFAYIEVSDHHVDFGFKNSRRWESPLWARYRTIEDAHPHFAMRRVTAPADIFPVFRDLFARSRTAA